MNAITTDHAEDKAVNTGKSAVPLVAITRCTRESNAFLVKSLTALQTVENRVRIARKWTGEPFVILMELKYIRHFNTQPFGDLSVVTSLKLSATNSFREHVTRDMMAICACSCYR